mmetsp:Transcript_6619/g.24739  ORF Transcript_6619/g.24739 Transcript_6619/m.24739 type:complete len:93 (+) Transcript_6619:3563-3841(+)
MGILQKNPSLEDFLSNLVTQSVYPLPSMFIEQFHDDPANNNTTTRIHLDLFYKFHNLHCSQLHNRRLNCRCHNSKSNSTRYNILYDVLYDIF